MGLFAPWVDSYSQNCSNQPNLNHKTVMSLFSTIVMCVLKLCKTFTRLFVSNDVYKIYVDCPYSSTAENNLNNNK